MAANLAAILGGIAVFHEPIGSGPLEIGARFLAFCLVVAGAALNVNRVDGRQGVADANGVMSSIGLFDTKAHADESTRLASEWVREQKLETALPNPPKITSGEVVVHKTRELVQA